MKTPVENSRALSSEAEVGFLVDTVSTPKLPGLIFKTNRAFFKVWVSGKQLDERRR